MTSLFDFEGFVYDWRIPVSGRLFTTYVERGEHECSRWKYTFIGNSCNATIKCVDCLLHNRNSSGSRELKILVWVI